VRRPHFVPLVNGVLVAHAHIATRTDGHQVFKVGGTTLAFCDIVTTLEIKHGNVVLTPTDPALAFKHTPHVPEPHLFT
jgi:hypothetical protein